MLSEKNKGKLTGWLGYTLSRSIRQFDRINLGRVYPYKFDRPHDLSVVSSYKLDEGTTLSLTGCLAQVIPLLFLKNNIF